GGTGAADGRAGGVGRGGSAGPAGYPGDRAGPDVAAAYQPGRGGTRPRRGGPAGAGHLRRLPDARPQLVRRGGERGGERAWARPAADRDHVRPAADRGPAGGSGAGYPGGRSRDPPWTSHGAVGRTATPDRDRTGATRGGSRRARVRHSLARLLRARRVPPPVPVAGGGTGWPARLHGGTGHQLRRAAGGYCGPVGRPGGGAPGHRRAMAAVPPRSSRRPTVRATRPAAGSNSSLSPSPRLGSSLSSSLSRAPLIRLEY